MRRRMGISAKATSPRSEGEAGEDEGEGVEVPHTQKQIDFIAAALSKHFLFTAVPLTTLEDVCRKMRYVQTPAGRAIVGRGGQSTFHLNLSHSSLHSSTFHVNLSRFCHVLHPQRIPQRVLMLR